MKIILFAGTTEGRQLAEALAGSDVELTVCVATEYGGRLLEALPEHVEVRAGRLDGEQMRALLRAGGYDLVVDATHPYAVEATRSLKGAASQADVPYRRLARPASRVQRQPAEAPGRRYVDTPAQAAELLLSTRGNILLTTGTKDLAVYTQFEGCRNRLYARVLPLPEALQACQDAGLPPSRCIGMQGPCSAALNGALMQEYGIRQLVTKDGGSPGGFPQKLEAAALHGAEVIVIGRQEQEAGDSLETLLEWLVPRRE